MNNVKDKLSASMRTVKAGEKPAAKPLAAKKTAARKPLASSKTIVPGDVPESGTALFPSRVWPD